VASSNVEQIIRTAARKYGVDENYLVHIAQCESGLNPNAVNHNYFENGYPSGLFQHLSGYFPSRAAKYGYSPDVFDAYSNANVTAAMFADGLQGLWECK
jgi:soluble lytic murein transglycosylase-like protein